MIRPAPAFRPVAASLLKREAGGRQEAPELVDAAERIYGKFCGQLAPILGTEGLRVVVARALRLGQAEFSFLQGVEIETQSEACLKGLHEIAHGLEPGELRRGIVAFIAGFVWLLATFIGEEMTLRLLARTWPDVSFDDEGEGRREVKQ